MLSGWVKLICQYCLATGFDSCQFYLLVWLRLGAQRVCLPKSGLLPRCSSWLLNKRLYHIYSFLSKFFVLVPKTGKRIFSQSQKTSNSNSGSTLLLPKMCRDPLHSHTRIYFTAQHSGKTDPKFINRHHDLPAELKALHESHSSTRTKPTVSELFNLLTIATKTYSKSLILLDALDECIEQTVMTRLLEELSNLQEEQPLYLFATSRPVPEIATKFTKLSTLEIWARDQDVSRFLEHHMNTLPSNIQRQTDLRDTIKAGILAASDGM